MSEIKKINDGEQTQDTSSINDDIKKRIKEIKERLLDKRNPPSKEYIIASMKFIKEVEAKSKLHDKLGNNIQIESLASMIELIGEMTNQNIDQYMELKKVELSGYQKERFVDGKKTSTVRYYLVPQNTDGGIQFRIQAVEEYPAKKDTKKLGITKTFNINDLDSVLNDARNDIFDSSAFEFGIDPRRASSGISTTSDGVSTGFESEGRKSLLKVGAGRKEDKYQTVDGISTGSVSGLKGDFTIEDESKYRLELGLMSDTSEMGADWRLRASYRMLYAGAKLGTYIGIDKGSNLEKYVLAQGFKIPGGKILLTGALLNRLEKISFSEVGVSKDVRMTQKSLGVDVSKGFDKESLLNEIKGSIVYFDVGGKKLGKIGDIVKDTATEYDWYSVYGGVRGGNKLITEFTSTLKIHERLKAGVGVGYERLQVEGMYDAAKETRHSPTAKIDFTGDITNSDRARLGIDYSMTSRTVKAGYEHGFDNGLSAFADASHTHNSMGQPDDKRVMFGIKGTFEGLGKKKQKMSPLFSDQATNPNLTLNDLSPNERVNTDNIQVKVPVIYKKHEVYIDKTKLPGASKIETDPDTKILKAIDFDTGANNLSSIRSTNLPNFLQNMSVKDSRFLRVAGFEKLKAPATYKIAINDTNNSTSLFEFTTTSGSVELKLSPKSANNIPTAAADRYIRGEITIEQAKEVVQQIPAPNPSNPGITNNPRPTWTWSAVNGATGYAISLDNGAYNVIGNATSFTPSSNLSDGQHTFSIRSINGNIQGNDIKTVTTTIDTTPVNTSLSATKTYNSARITINSNEVGTGHYLIKLATDPVPTEAEVKAGASVQLANGSNTVDITSLSPDTQYVFYFIAQDNIGTGNSQNAKSSLNIKTDIAPDVQAPVLMTFAANPSTPTSVSFKAKINENGIGYYIVLPKGSPAPSNEQIKSGNFAGKINSGSQTMIANTDANVTINGLLGSTGYDVYFAAQDNAGNLQAANNGALTLNTLATPDTLPPSTSINLTPGDTSVQFIVNMNEAGEIRYINQLSNLPAPSLDAVKSGTAVSANPGNNSFSVNGLNQLSDYKLYYIAKDNAGNWQPTANEKGYSTLATPDILPPSTTINVSANDTTAQIIINTSEAGEIRYLLLPAGSPAPSKAAVEAGTQVIANTGNNTVNLTGLTQLTNYDFYFIAKDAAGNWQANPTDKPFSTIATPDIIPPTLLTFSSNGSTNNSLSFKTKLNENGTGYYLVVPAGSPAPSNLQIMSGTVAGKVASGSLALSANTSVDTTVSGLTGNTSYDVYFVAKDNANNLQSENNSPLNVLTLADAPSSMPTGVSLSAGSDSGISSNDGLTNVIKPTINWNAVAGATSYEISFNGGSSYTDIGNTTTYTPSIGLVDGTYTIKIRGKNSTGTGPDASLSVTIDTMSPGIPTITVVTLTNETRPTWSWGAVNGAVQYEISNNGGASWVNVGNSLSFTPSSPLADGTYKLSVRAMDAAGNYSNGSPDATTTIDTQAPDVNTIIISGGAGSEIGYTNSPTVNLTVAGTDPNGITGWLVTETSTTPAAASVINNQPTSYTFSSGDGLKTLYVWAKDGVGNISQMRSASITLDSVAPNSLAWSGTIPSNQGTAYNYLTLTVSESVQENIIGQTGTTLKGGNYIVTGVAGNEITINYTSPTGLVGLPTQKKDTITINNIKDSAGNASTLSVQTNPLS